MAALVLTPPLARRTAVAAAPVAPAAVAALAIVPAAAVLPHALVPLAQLLHAHLQALAGELASGHRAAFAVAAALLPAFIAALVPLPHRRPLRTLAALPLAALFAAAAPFATGVAPAVVALAVAQLLAALLQAFAHRLEALFGLLQALAHFGARSRLAVRPLRPLALLGGGEGREEQTEHENQAVHCDHLTGRWKAAGNAPHAAIPTCACTAKLSRLRPQRCREHAAPMPWATKRGAGARLRRGSGRVCGPQRVPAASA